MPIVQKNNLKNQKKSIQKEKNKFLAESYFIASCISFIFLIYAFSLPRPWLPFDERLFFAETLFPIPQTFEEIKEVINEFGKNYHVESMNTFFSNIVTLRSNPLAAKLVIYVSFFLKKNALAYHLLQLSIHLFNAFLLWVTVFLLKDIFLTVSDKADKKLLNKNILIVISILVCLWGVHSASTEAVLLVTNWDTILTYSFCLLFLIYEIFSLNKSSGKIKFSILKTILVSSLFLILMTLTEYAYSFPLIIFFIAMSIGYKLIGNLKDSIKAAFKISTPYFMGLGLFALYHFSKEDSLLKNIFISNTGYSPFYVFVERNLWLSPQIFIHILKLLFLPIKLSLYQSNLVHLSQTLIDFHSVSSALIYILFLFTPIMLFLKWKKYGFIFILFYSFFFSIFPFLQIIAPTYCLCADRYIYFPSMFLAIIIFGIITYKSKFFLEDKSKITITVLSSVLVFMSLRTLIRIQDWSRPEKLLNSAVQAENDLLYKGQKRIILASYEGILGKKERMAYHLKIALSELERKLNSLEKNKTNNPITLKIYGLDNNSLILKTAYAIATIKNDYLFESPEIVLNFYEPYIKKYFDITSINQLSLYSDILLKVKNYSLAKEVLDQSIKKYPFSSVLIVSLTKLHLRYTNDLDSASRLLITANKYFPQQIETLKLNLEFYEKKNDLHNQAKYAYLIGLREHSEKSYQRAVQLFLDEGNLVLAHHTLKKLAKLNPNSALTFLLTSRYLDVRGNPDKALETLNTAYHIFKSPKNKEDISVFKSILVSLIKVNSHFKNTEQVKLLIAEFESIKNLNDQDKMFIAEFKSL